MHMCFWTNVGHLWELGLDELVRLGVSSRSQHLISCEESAQIGFEYTKIVLFYDLSTLFSLLLEEDRWKIGNLTKLNDLNLNGNPLGVIPALNLPFVRSLALQDASLTSASFPEIYSNALLLQRLSLNQNKIRTVNANDFAALKDSRLSKLSLDDTSLTQIDRNAFSPLTRLQSLSLDDNQLKSCEFLSTFRLLSSIKLDRNQFTSLPDQLSAPNNIKSFSFKGNLISTIDDSSPLYIWQKKNYTNLKVYLVNNTIDCCQSRWFIRFLATSANLVGDALNLTCATPSSFAGKKLIELHADEMNCAGVTPSKPWLWISLASAGGVLLAVIAALVIVFVLRRRRSHSGYTEIDGDDDPSPTAPFLSSSGPAFPAYGEDDDTYSEHQTVISTRDVDGSEGPTLRIAPSTVSLNSGIVWLPFSDLIYSMFCRLPPFAIWTLFLSKSRIK